MSRVLDRGSGSTTPTTPRFTTRRRCQDPSPNFTCSMTTMRRKTPRRSSSSRRTGSGGPGATGTTSRGQLTPIVRTVRQAAAAEAALFLIPSFARRSDSWRPASAQVAFPPRRVEDAGTFRGNGTRPSHPARSLRPHRARRDVAPDKHYSPAHHLARRTPEYSDAPRRQVSFRARTDQAELRCRTARPHATRVVGARCVAIQFLLLFSQLSSFPHLAP